MVFATVTVSDDREGSGGVQNALNQSPKVFPSRCTKMKRLRIRRRGEVPYADHRGKKCIYVPMEKKTEYKTGLKTVRFVRFQ